MAGSIGLAGGPPGDAGAGESARRADARAGDRRGRDGDLEWAGDWREDAGDWREDAGDWREGAGDWREGAGDWHEGGGEWHEGGGEWHEGAGEWYEGAGEWHEGGGEWRGGGAASPEALRAERERRWAPRAAAEAALAVVRAFIAARRLVVFGGLAIDYALRLRGGALYGDEELPDYDFFSPDGVNDAYDLADALAAAGHEADVIRGIHTQTMRVRVGGRSVADVGAVPPAVFAAIPALEFGAPPVRFAAPAWQRVDMHLAFCFPYQGAPLEDAYNRWAKDAARLALLAAAYPPELDAGPDTAPEAIPAPAGTKPKSKAPKAPPKRSGGKESGGKESGGKESVVEARPAGGEAGYALTGEAGYAFYLARLPAAARAGLPAVGLEWAPGVVRLTGAAGPVAVASPAPAAVFGSGEDSGTDGGEVEWYEPFLDALPETAVRGALAVYSTAGRLLATAAAGEHGPPGGRVASLHHVAATLLAEAAAAGAAGARALLPARRARELYAAAAALAGRAAALPDAEMPAAEFARWFAPATEPLGDRNGTPSHAIAAARMVAEYGPPPGGAAALGLPDDYAAVLEGLQRNWYAGRPRPPPYDYASPLFSRGRRPMAAGADDVAGNPGAGKTEAGKNAAPSRRARAAPGSVFGGALADFVRAGVDSDDDEPPRYR